MRKLTNKAYIVKLVNIFGNIHANSYIPHVYDIKQSANARFCTNS